MKDVPYWLFSLPFEPVVLLNIEKQWSSEGLIRVVLQKRWGQLYDSDEHFKIMRFSFCLVEMQLEWLKDSIDLLTVIFVLFSPIKDMISQRVDDFYSFLSFGLLNHRKDRILFKALADQRRIPFHQTQQKGLAHWFYLNLPVLIHIFLDSPAAVLKGAIHQIHHKIAPHQISYLLH